MNIKKLFLALLTITMVAPLAQTQAAEASLSKRVDEKIAKVVGKENVSKTKKIVLGVVGTTAAAVVTYFGLRWMLKPCLQSNRFEDQQSSKEPLTRDFGILAGQYQYDNPDAGKKITPIVKTRAAIVKRFFRKFLCVKPLKEDNTVHEQIIL